MSEANGPVCPECATPRAADGTPACSCARHASDARREARTAEAAAAEDFDPVRIRPFVALDDDQGPATEEQPPREPRELPGEEIPASPAPAKAAPAAELPLPQGPRHGRRPLLLAGAGATLAVLLTGAYLGGLFTYESPSRDGSLSDGLRAPVPDATTEDGTSPEGQSRATASPTRSRTSTPAPDPSPTGDSPSPSVSSATPTAAPSSAGPTDGAAPEPSETPGRPPVLSLGDQGPEVAELQLRLREIGLYAADADGDYDRQVESSVRTYQLTRVILDDDSGVYGLPTRASLESETTEP
ncbi:peptidoglycan-binding protein [Streptomyces sp. NPDC093568]|uniref:peptidoglycan-binding domain-containing protein n=1 Tax=Streptomyces sp. NPDC093568 TaxID=3366041 RepID=UPI00381610E9